MNFDQLEARFRDLVAQRQAGTLQPQDFTDLCQALRTQDAQQRWWQMDPATGHWLVWNGSQWQPGQPPRSAASGVPPPTPTPTPTRATASAAQGAAAASGAGAGTGAAATGTGHTATAFAQNLWQRLVDRLISPREFLRQGKLPLAQRSQGWWDVLGIAGGALSGYIWFLYGSIRGMPHFKLIGMSGGRDVWYDFMPAMVLVALPFLLFAYRGRILEKLDPIWTKARLNPSYGLTLAGAIVGGALALNYLGPVLFSWAFAFREGLDFTTPLLMVSIPLGLALFRPETDKLLMPLKPVRDPIPKFLLVGIALATPYALAYVLYRSVNQYELLHWNVALGILIPYVLLRSPQAGTLLTDRAGVVRALLWLSPLVLIASGIYAPDAFADDCGRDIFNLRDCLRTGGFAQTMSGTAATVVSVLVNGAEIMRIFIIPEAQPPAPQGPGDIPPDGPPEVPPEGPAATPPDVEWVSPDGRNNTLVWDAAKGGYINILTGGFIAQEDVGKWKANVSENIARTDDWRQRNADLAASGQDGMSRALQDIADKYQAQQVQNQAESEKWKQWFKDILQAEMERNRALSAAALESAASAGKWLNRAEWVVSAADTSINVLATVTGPVGKSIKSIYTVTKDISKNLSAANAQGQSLAGGLGKGLLEAGFDLGFDKLKSTKAIQKIPGFGKYAGGKLSGESLGTIEKGIAQTLSNQLNDALVKQNLIRNAFKDGIKSAAQSQMQKMLIKDPLKKILGLK